MNYDEKKFVKELEKRQRFLLSEILKYHRRFLIHLTVEF